MKYDWPLSTEHFVGLTPSVIRDRADWQASFLAHKFGEEALTGLAIYFGQLGANLTDRMMRRNRETALIAADISQDFLEALPQQKGKTLTDLFKD